MAAKSRPKPPVTIDIGERSSASKLGKTPDTMLAEMKAEGNAPGVQAVSIAYALEFGVSTAPSCSKEEEQVVLLPKKKDEQRE